MSNNFIFPCLVPKLVNGCSIERSYALWVCLIVNSGVTAEVMSVFYNFSHLLSAIKVNFSNKSEALEPMCDKSSINCSKPNK